MSSKFIMFILCMFIGIALIFPYDDYSIGNMIKMVFGTLFIALAGALNYSDLKDTYEDRMGK